MARRAVLDMRMYKYGRFRDIYTGLLVPWIEKPKFDLEYFQWEVAHRVRQTISKDFPELYKNAQYIIDSMIDMQAKTHDFAAHQLKESRALDKAEYETLFAVSDMLKVAYAIVEQSLQQVHAIPLRTPHWMRPATMRGPLLGFVGAAHTAASGLGAIDELTYLASTDFTKLPLEQAQLGLSYALADSIVRLGEFISEHAVSGYLISGPASAITFEFEPGLEAARAMFEALGTPAAFTALFGDAVYLTKDQIITNYIRVIRLLMKSKNVEAIGGTYAAPITNTGRLAQSIGEIDFGPRVSARAELPRRRGQGEVVVATVGIRDPGTKTSKHQPPGIYGEVLAKARQSAPPSLTFSGSSKERAAKWFGNPAIRERFMAWGTQRGLSHDMIEAVMAKVFKHGTHGRAWMAQIAADVSPGSMDFVGEAMLEELREIWSGLAQKRIPY